MHASERAFFIWSENLSTRKIKHNPPPLAKSSVLRFGFLEDLDFWNQDVKSTLLVDPAGQKPNTLNPDLVK
jgi:hypothetical protein